MASSSSFIPYIVKLYYGGEVTYENGCVTGDEHTQTFSFLVTGQHDYSSFVDLICTQVQVDRGCYNVELTLYFQYGATHHSALLTQDTDMQMIYHLSNRIQNYVAEIHVRLSPINHQPNCLELLQGLGISQTYPGLDDIQTQECTYNQEPYNNSNNEANAYTDFEDTEPDTTEEREDSPPEDYHSEEDEQIPPLPTHYSEGIEHRFPDLNGLGDEIDEEYMELDNLDEEEMRFWKEDPNEICLNMYFKTKKQLDRAVRLWNVDRNREIFITNSRPIYYQAICFSMKNPDSEPPTACRWTISASKLKNSNFWMVTRWTPAHSCFSTVAQNNNMCLRANVVAENIRPQIVADVSFAVKNIKALKKDRYAVDITYGKAWAARKKAIEGLYGTWEDNFHALPSYLMALQQSNAGTVVEWLHHQDSPPNYQIFKYVFWAFRPSILAFEYCIPVISIDATHLKGQYKGKLLVAVSKNANNMILPLAYAVVDEETTDSWTWFLQQIQDHVADPTKRALCVISNRHKGILNAMTEHPGWSNAAHRYCLRHVRSNFMSHFKSVSLKKLCWDIGSTTQPRKYSRLMTEVKRTNVEAWKYLKNMDKEKWTLLHDKGNRRWGVLTTNISECLNNVLRAGRLLPIQALVDYTFRRDVEQYAKNFNNANNCSTDLPSFWWKTLQKRESRGRQHSVFNYDVRQQRFLVETRFQTDEEGADGYIVEFFKKTCTCGRWQVCRFPCSHVCAVCTYTSAPQITTIDERFHTTTYQAQYNNHYFPVPHRDYWDFAGWTLRGDASKVSVKRGRRRARRMHNEMDQSYPEERQRRCSGCKQPGHMINRCPHKQR